jgi:cell division cycle 2-like protein
MTGQPLLPGKDDLDQLHCILELFGSPTPQLWPSVVDLPLVRSRAVDLRTLLAKYRYNNLGAVLGRFGAPAVSFVNALLVYDPALRPSSADCLAHPYFSSSPLPQEPALMPTFPSTHRDAGAPSEHSRKRKAR